MSSLDFFDRKYERAETVWTGPQCCQRLRQRTPPLMSNDMFSVKAADRANQIAVLSWGRPGH
ncbi:hypothetical protein MPLDJ20_260058 [Mesorhizobium plurifarium]|uniref:Uncharacterized protein n=1 Tax=Mesorhizobium plurifarium TaxID=69974 RepID=A0A090F6T4_MESPL|nr:hypothetical protein MPLDJ20_260058 [Mesorhizobium plurifarium]